MICESDRLRFDNIVRDAVVNGGDMSGIGTLAERSLHLILKRYFGGEGEFAEVPYMGFVADVKRGSEITEIQTSTLSGMRDKLSAFFTDCRVRIVWPVAVYRRIVWIDPSSGDVMPSRRAAPRQTPISILPQLVCILDCLTNPSLTLTLVSLALDEYRVRGGRMSRGRKADLKLDRVPTELRGITDIHLPEDAAILMPDALPSEFTRAEFSAASGLRGRDLWAALKVLEHLGTICRLPTDGRLVVYRNTSARPT